MFSFLRRRLSFANLVVVLVLLLTLSGGAYAAGKFLITSTKQISPKVLKQLKGKAGPAGKQGVAGKEGKPGVEGKEGKPGAEGKAGANGVNGESVTSAEVKTSEAECSKLGGSKFAVGGKTTFACNGREGKEGKPGNPAEYPLVLPKGRSETGTWTMAISGSRFRGNETFPFVGFTTLSYPIPVSFEEEPKQVHVLPAGAPSTTECPGSEEEPKAEPGNICLYVHEEFPEEATKKVLAAFPKLTGTTVIFEAGKATEGYAYGTWAIQG